MVRQLEGEISTAVRTLATPDSTKDDLGFLDDGTAGFGAAMSWGYRSDGLAGTIFLTAAGSGSDLQLVIVLVERLPG